MLTKYEGHNMNSRFNDKTFHEFSAVAAQPEIQIAGRIKHISRQLELYFQKILEGDDITLSQVEVLFITYLAPDKKLDLTSISKQAQVSKATISGIVSRLRKKGYVFNEACPHDARVTYLKLTELGIKIIQKSFNSFATAAKVLTEDIPKEDLETSQRVLSIIEEKIHNIYMEK